MRLLIATVPLLLVLAGCQEPKSSAPAADQVQPEPASPPVAQTAYGPVRGLVDDGVLVFKGIRYGADTATTRFAAPKPPEPWTEVRDALEYGNSAMQASNPVVQSSSLFQSWNPDPVPARSEDCLFLNVWTPAIADGAKRPVMVWFHGGGYAGGDGSGTVFDGVNLVNRGDVVVVTVNHRLNVFGHLYLDEFGESFAGSGNAGILDLVASLEWVRDNISEFGGDPDNVMIFGESGGGWKVTTLMAMDAAEGLFHRAVAQSGPALTLTEKEDAAVASRALVAKLGLEASTIEQIQTLPAEDIANAAMAVAMEAGLIAGAGPVVDGVHFNRHPFTPDAPMQSKNVPLLIGTTRTELSMLEGLRRPDLFKLTWETLPAALEASIEDIDATQVIKQYRAWFPDIDAPTLYFDATTADHFLVTGSFALADRKAAQGGAPVYQYYLTWGSPVDGGKWGAVHGLDQPFVFDNVEKFPSMSGTGEAQQALADMMSEAWLAFARTGDPNHPGLPKWETYDTERRATMVFDVKPALVDDPRGREFALLGVRDRPAVARGGN